MRLSRKLSVVVFLLSFASVAFGQSKTEYQKYLAKAKEYESQKRWVYALDAYYDAMGTDEKTENKMEAYERYNALADAIKSGNPGLGKFDKSLIHNEWKKLLIDTEKYGCSICKYDIIVNLKDSYLNSKTKTTTVSFTIDYLFGNRYSKTIGVIEEGYKVALNKAKSSSDYTFDYLYGDWEGIPKDWPIHSVSSRQDDYKNYNRNGTLFYDYAYGWVSPELEVVPMSGKNDYLNAFMADEIQTFDYYEGSPFKTPYEFEFNIIDSKGKELAKSDKISLGNNKIIYFNGLRSDIVELIKSGQATINLKNCYLKYGMYLYNRGTKSLKEQKIVKETVSLISWFDYIDSRMISLDEIAIKMLNTEVTQELYESLMESNPSSNKGK
ncbi:MAG: hypothetical protein J5857_11590, partial [Treponema sp.]|nr:hypothetical protein [Treponema sp.]